jgi:hypothetical protein
MEVKRVDSPLSTTANEVDMERAWVGLAERAIVKSGFSQKTAAGKLETDRGSLSAQLACAPNRHLSFRKMWRLGPDFALELVLLIIEFYDLQIGITEQERRDLACGRAIREALELRSLAR